MTLDSDTLACIQALRHVKTYRVEDDDGQWTWNHAEQRHWRTLARRLRDGDLKLVKA